MLSEVVTCNCVRNRGGHAELHPRPSKEGVSFYHVLRPLDSTSVSDRSRLPLEVSMSLWTGACNYLVHTYKWAKV